MSQFIGRKARVVRLHTPAHAPDLGSLGNVVTETHKINGDLSLTVIDGGNVLVTGKSAKTGESVEVVLYAANIIDVVLKPVQDKAKVIGKIDLPKEA